jgi:hypothetical protein
MGPRIAVVAANMTFVNNETNYDFVDTLCERVAVSRQYENLPRHAEDKGIHGGDAGGADVTAPSTRKKSRRRYSHVRRNLAQVENGGLLFP